ncbi:AraC family transcriptional regulator [Paenibacillus gorillae]|uniref:AraC family transcriptional regulator n=1 Tax=Paenibacillus gorillae TaxID=1243662 RepID=UPI0004ACD4B5|nr:cache domain-containing protein [Paenibacillus gorillae]
MKNGRPRNNVSFFHKSLIITLLISSIPLITLAILTYYTGVREIEREVGRTQELQYAQVSERMDAQLTQLKMTVNQWAYNPLIMELPGHSIGQDVRYTLDLFNQLVVMKQSDPLISQVSLLLGGNKPLLIDGEDGSRPLPQELFEAQFLPLLEQQQMIFWTDRLDAAENLTGNSLSLSLVQKVPVLSDPAYGAIIVGLNKGELASLVEQLSPPEKGSAFIFNPDQDYLVASAAYPAGADNNKSKLNDAILAAVQNSGKNSGSFSYSLDREVYVVTYGHLKSTGWLYVCATPLSHLIKPVERIFKLPLFAGILGLVIAFILSWLASKQLYRPLLHLTKVFGHDQPVSAADAPRRNEVQFIESRWNYLLRERTDMKFKLEKAMPALRDGFVLQLVQGHLNALPDYRIREQFEQYELPTEYVCYSMLLVELSGFANRYGNLTSGDDRLLTFAAANIMEEMLQELQQSEHSPLSMPALVINFQDLTIGVLFTHSDELAKEQIKAAVSGFGRQLIAPLQTYLKLQATVGVSRVTTSVKHLSIMLEDTRRAMRHRGTETGDSVIDTEAAAPAGEPASIYPFLQGNLLLQALQSGMEEQAAQHAEAFMDALRAKSSNAYAIQQGMLQLLGNVLFTMIQMGSNPQRLYKGINLYEQLLQLREPSAMLNWFNTAVLAPFMEEMQSHKDMEIKQTVEKVMALMQEHYMQDLSLEDCAERFGTYPQKLSVSFRQYAGVNFIDYLTRLRLNRSKELLVGTHLKISEIAAQVGYQPAYYNRTFKKHEGLTPGQYREKHTPE